MFFKERFDQRQVIGDMAREIVSRLPVSGEPVVFATDIDGTITDERDRVPRRTRKQLRQAPEDGIHPVFITGRTPKQLTPDFQRTVFPESTLVGVNGGSTIIEYDSTETVIGHAQLGEADLRCILSPDVVPHAAFYLYAPRNHYQGTVLWAPRPPTDDRMRSLYSFYSKIANPYTHEGLSHPQVLERAIADEPSSISVVTEKPQEVIDQLPDTLNAAVSDEVVIDITQRDVHKGTALKLMVASMGASLEKCIVVGNDSNDVPMLTLPGVRVVIFVGNKEGIVDDTHNGHGVLRVPSAGDLGILLKQVRKEYRKSQKK